MESTRFDYAELDRSAERLPRIWRVVTVGGIVLGAMYVLYLTPFARWERRIDPVTGSIKESCVWVMGLWASERIETSPLEQRLKQAGIPWAAKWEFNHANQVNILGDVLVWECATGQPIYHIRHSLGGFAATATDEQLREFVSVMESGTRAEQQAAVEAVFDQWTAAPSVRSP
jgi:hypothetical protein